MENKCEKCGGELIAGRLATGAHLVGFIPFDDEKKFKTRYAKVLCSTCLECGNIQDFRVENPEVLK